MTINHSEYLKIALSPSSYFSKSSIEILESKLADMYKSKKEPKVFLTENGRSAMYLFLSSLGLPAGSKVAVQPFTCNSAVNPIIWSGLEPVYIDIRRDNLSMDPNKLEEAVIKHEIKVVIIQHTFGSSARIEEIKKVCEENNILLFEDCAHALGASVNGRRLGTFGDASLVSFGLEKNLPTKAGGALLVHNQNIRGKIEESYQKYPEVSLARTILWLKNPFIRVVSRKMGTFGEKMIEIFESLGIFETGFSKEEFEGGMPSRYPKKISNPIAAIAVGYFPQIDSMSMLRSDQSEIYSKSLSSLGYNDNQGPIEHRIAAQVNAQSESGTSTVGNNGKPVDNRIPYLKYPFFAKSKKERDNLKLFLTDRGYYIANWYDYPVYPVETDLKSLRYKLGSCPVAEKASDTVINLPTGDPFDEEIPKLIHEFYSN